MLEARGKTFFFFKAEVKGAYNQYRRGGVGAAVSLHSKQSHVSLFYAFMGEEGHS